MAQKHGLGRGLGALIRDNTPVLPTGDSSTPGVTKVAVTSIRKGSWQPRRAFDEDALAELTASIEQHGVLQPLLVRGIGDSYEIIAGERRFRAARAAGLQEVPVIIMDVADRDALELALTENLQREDLNVMEEAAGYQLLVERFTLTQEQIAQRVGRARASVANTMRLLSLPPEIRNMLSDDTLSVGHAKAILALEISEEQILMANRAIAESLSVRNLEKAIQKLKRAPRKQRGARTDLPNDHLAYLSDRLHSHFGTSVRIKPSRTYANGKKGKGSIEIDFYSNEELDGILDILGLTEEQ